MFLTLTCYVKSGVEISICGINIGAQKVSDFRTFQIVAFQIRDAEPVYLLSIGYIYSH